MKMNNKFVHLFAEVARVRYSARLTEFVAGSVTCLEKLQMKTVQFHGVGWCEKKLSSQTSTRLRKISVRPQRCIYILEKYIIGLDEGHI